MLYDEIKCEIPKCSACKAYMDARHAYCEPIGAGRKIAFVTDDFSLAKGEWLSERMESYILEISSDLGLDFSRDVQIIPAYKCNGKKNPSLTASLCRFQISTILKESKASSVVLLGKNALINVVGNSWKRDIGELDRWRGFAIPLNGKWVIPTYNPFDKYGTMNSKTYREDPITNRALNQDITKAYSLIGTRLPKHDPTCLVITPIESINILRHILDDVELVAFDYETTGLRPYNNGHEIVSVSFAFKQNGTIKSFAFMVEKTNLHMIKEVLTTASIQKIASNMKFEDTWGKVLFGVQTKGWYFDTMLAQHIIDGREGICSLKFQAFVRYGVQDYESEVKPFLTAKGNDSLNEIRKCDCNKLLYYNALDSWYEYKLAEDMMSELEYG